MQLTTTLLALAFSAFVAADLHSDGICYDVIGGQDVYNADATVKACGNYFMRNTGDEQWDKCPDCKMIETSGLNHCNSVGWHIGGDEWNYYCKLNGAGESGAN